MEPGVMAPPPGAPPGAGADVWLVVAGCLAHPARTSIRTTARIVTAFDIASLPN
jgi:hypothetical protein